MGFFQDLWDVTTGKKKSAFSVLSGARTIRGLVSGEETFSSAFSKDYDWILGENSMFGLSDEQKDAKLREEQLILQQQAQQQAQFDEIKGLYQQGFESTGLTYNQGLTKQNNNGYQPTYPIQQKQFAPNLQNGFTDSGLYTKYNQGLTRGGF